MNEHTLKRRCTFLNNFLNQEDFYARLATISNYDFDTLITNLSMIISYFLNSDTPIENPNLEEFLNEIKKHNLTNSNYYIYPTNSQQCLSLTLQGLNPKIDFARIIGLRNEKNLLMLEKEVSFYPLELDATEPKFYQDVKEAVHESINSPSRLFKSILKQPTVNNGEEVDLPQPSSFTEEIAYYQAILKVRLLNLHTLPYETGAQIGTKAISTYANKETLLTIIPSFLVEDNSSFIPPKYLSFVKLPSKFALLKLCHLNDNQKEIHPQNDTSNFTSISDAPPAERPFLVSYSRYELITISEQFSYINPELTGDIEYDIDLIYGKLDSNNSRSRVSPKFFENLNVIRERNDITLRQIAGKYEITNGRHRLIYLKHFYTRNYQKYQSLGCLEKLKDQLTLPINVEHYIEDNDFNAILREILKSFPKSRFLKSNINDESLSTLILLDNYAYNITSIEELKELYQYLKNGIFINKYFLTYSNGQNKNASFIFDHLIVTLQEKIFTMDIIDIINYIKKHPLTLDNETISLEDLDLYTLYLKYLTLQTTKQINEMFHLNKNIISDAKKRIKMRYLGEKIIAIVNSNPEFIYYDWQDLVQVLRQDESLKDFDQDFLYDCANMAGYPQIKFQAQTKIHNRKKV